jgi:hypothetical protein
MDPVPQYHCINTPVAKKDIPIARDLPPDKRNTPQNKAIIIPVPQI